MTDDVLQQVDAFTTPGTLLKAAREAQGMPEREAADRLNLMPDYVAILERDDYESLRSPAFARGYVRAYGKMLKLDETHLLDTFDQMRASDQAQARANKRIETRPLQLQRTGLGVVIGLAVLLLLVLALWLWQGDTGALLSPADNAAAEQLPGPSPQPSATGEQ